MGVRAKAAPFLRPLRQALQPVGRWRRRSRYMREGIEGICMELRRTIDCGPILREWGARVGPNDSIHGPMHIMNAGPDLSRLNIGRDVYIGPDVLIDLADSVTIGNYVSIVARSSLITHIDVGNGPLKARRPRQQAPVVIEDGAYLGVGATILHGVTVGREATVGAHALVRKDVPAGATVVSPEAVPLTDSGGA